MYRWPVQVEFRYTDRDYKAIGRWMTRRPAVTRRGILVALFGIAVSFAWMGSVDLVYATIWACVIATAMFLRWLTLPALGEEKLKEWVSGVYRVEADDQGFRVQTDSWTKYYPWTIVDEVHGNEEYLYLIARKQITAIPAHAFGSHREFVAFSEEVRVRTPG